MTPILVYCSYPIIDRSEEPEWVGMLEYLIANKALENVVLYRPFYTIEAQKGVKELLDREETAANIMDLTEVLKIDSKYVPYNSQTAILLEDKASSLAQAIVGKELWILSRCHVVVTDCDLPDRGDRDITTLIAKIFQLPIVGVSSRFLAAPWLAALVDVTTSPQSLGDTLQGVVNREIDHLAKEALEAKKESDV